VSGAVTATTLVIGGAAPAHATGSEPKDGSCTNVTVLGLRGSWTIEKSAGVKPGKMNPENTFGNVNTASINELVRQVPKGTTVKRVAVPYETAIEKVDSTDGGVTSAKNYRLAITEGVELLNQYANDALSACPKTKLVFIGYSQGAQVVHEAVSNLPQATLDATGAVWLIGDPISRSTAKNQYRFAGDGDGVAPRSSSGIYYVESNLAATYPEFKQFLKFAPEKEPAFSDSLKDKLISVCDNADEACSAPTPLTTESDYFPHGDAYFLDRLMSPSAKWVAESIAKSYPKECTDVIFVAARGSGEGEDEGHPVQTEAKDSHFPGYGNTIATMVYQVKATLPDRLTTSFEYIAYQALSVEDAMSPLPSRYPRSVDTGIRGGAAFNNSPDRMYEGGVKSLKKKIADCPQSKLMTLGYSQGAHAMHEIMMRLERTERDRIYASILIADANRNKDDSEAFGFFGATTSFASKDSLLYQGNGVMRVAAHVNQTCKDIAATPLTGELFSDLFKKILIGPTVAECDKYFPKDIQFTDVTSFKTYDEDMNSKILNVCSLDDLVCQVKAPDSASPAALIPFIDNFAFNATHVDEIHGNGYKDPKFYGVPGLWGARQLLNE
jgi:predicted esterase